jgi:hypothetical protein
MSQVVTVSVGRLLQRGELVNTAKINAIVKSIVINISGATGTEDLSDGAVTPAKTSPGNYWDAAATLSGSTYTAAYAPIAVTSYPDGLLLSAKVDSDSPEGAMFDAGAGAKPLYRYGGQAKVAPGDIRRNSRMQLRYNTTLVVGGCWEVMSLIGPVPVSAAFQGASDRLNGERGLVPAPKVGEQNYLLAGDGKFRDPNPQIDARVTQQIGGVTALAQWLTNLN